MALDNAFDIVASAARTTSGVSPAFSCEWNDSLTIVANVTAASGTTPTLALTVEWSLDGTTFGVAEGAVNFASITAAKNALLRLSVVAPYFRVRWVVAGTTPSFTFDLKAYTAAITRR